MSKMILPIRCIPLNGLEGILPTEKVLLTWQYKTLKPGQSMVSLDASSKPQHVYVLVSPEMTLWDFASLPEVLSDDYDYRVENNEYTQRLIDGWVLGCGDQLRLELPDGYHHHLAMMNAHHLLRDWVNAPPNVMTSEHLADSIKSLANQYDGLYSEWRGNDLADSFPLIHAVGRGSEFEPIMTQIKWSKPNAPKLVLIGKGVCFDSGGLDLKPSSAMKLMKKDMGGAAHAAALASWLVATGVELDITLLIPCVENMVSSKSFRVSDVLKSRSGLTVEIGNTDAEGRLVLADALSYSDCHHPDLLIDFATLTGAARVALGHDVPAYFTNDDHWAKELEHAAETTVDPVWRMPLYGPYRDQLNSDVADVHSTGSSGLGGAITAALFLETFIPKNTSWMHFDVHAYHLKARPGRPKGGAANALRACYLMCQQLQDKD